MLKKITDKKAFTLIETLITLALFSVVALIATNIYVSVTYVQTRVASLQKIQEDIRYVMESMAQSVRLGIINYDYYIDPDGNGNYDDTINLLDQPDILALRDQTGDYNFYRKSGDLLQFCTGTLSDCGSTSNNWQDITPKGVKVDDLSFVITPSADPFTSLASTPTCLGSCSAQYLSYNCVSGQCQYETDGHKFQPKVKIILKTESSGERIAEKASMLLQTIVSTRIPQFEVKNLNYD